MGPFDSSTKIMHFLYILQVTKIWLPFILKVA